MKLNTVRLAIIFDQVLSTGGGYQQALNVAISISKNINRKYYTPIFFTIYPENLPKRFWLNLLKKYSIDGDKQWANISKKEGVTICQALVASSLNISGQNRFKDEFVECGGVSLTEIDFKTMQSKICPRLYFAGEILDVDGITGGFNFQNAWTTGWLAAQHMVSR